MAGTKLAFSLSFSVFKKGKIGKDSVQFLSEELRPERVRKGEDRALVFC